MKKTNAGVEKKVDVIITLKDGYDPELLKLDAYKTLMSTIIVATIDEDKIEELSKNENVIAVEKDSPMGIL